jgi:hypothetical protein
MKADEQVGQETIQAVATANGMRCGTWGADASGDLKFYDLPPHTWDEPYFLVFPRYQGGRKAATGGAAEVEMTDEQRVAFWRLQDEAKRYLYTRLHDTGLVSDEEMREVTPELDKLDEEREGLLRDEQT